MIRNTFYIFIIFCSGLVAAETLVSAEPDANKFYQGFRQLVLAGDREKVSELIHYPLSGAIQTKADLLASYEAVFTEHLVSLIACTETVEEVGWRGHMLPEGALWISSFYYGHIKPDKSSPTYVDDFKARIADTENWYMRVIGINKGVGKCIKANG